MHRSPFAALFGCCVVVLAATGCSGSAVEQKLPEALRGPPPKAAPGDVGGVVSYEPLASSGSSSQPEEDAARVCRRYGLKEPETLGKTDNGDTAKLYYSCK
ncbi:MAG TPA: hypothetical protein VGD08_02440 [Stellaceae bacterium]|jgi:hypothetical protein